MKHLCVPMLTAMLWIPCLVQCLPAFTRKGEGYSPCLVDGDCLSVQHCQWLPSDREPNGWCVFDSNKVSSRGHDEYHRDKRFRRDTYSEDSLDGINQLTNDMQPQVRGVNDPNKMNDDEYATIYNEHGNDGLLNEGRPMSRTENQPMLDQVVEDGINPQNSDSELVINEDNTHDVYELNNDNDINRIYIPTQRSLALYLNGGGPDRIDNRNQLQDSDEHQNKANGMEEDVGFADDVVHNPLELAAAAEAAAIRDGDDIPDDFDHSNGLGWQGGDGV